MSDDLIERLRLVGASICAEAAARIAALEAELEALRKPLPESIERKTKEILRRVLELDDRTSPPDYPEMLMLTADELISLLDEMAEDIAPTIIAQERERAAKVCEARIVMHVSDFHSATAPEFADRASCKRAEASACAAAIRDAS
jgi:hypothetical protein